jgi:hypothetical protein
MSPGVQSQPGQNSEVHFKKQNKTNQQQKQAQSE